MNSLKFLKNGCFYIPILMVALLISATAAQEQAGEEATEITVTGCLQEGNEMGEFHFKAADGTTYGLTGDGVDLGPHVGHEISVTGKLAPSEGAGEASHQHLEVTSMQHISATCS